jgi:hypothetical protein
LSEASKEAVFLKEFLNELIGRKGAIKMYNDSQSAKKLTQNRVFHNRSKHIDIKYHHIRDQVKKGEVVIEYLQT